MACGGAQTFDLHCFQSLTGTKFFVTSEPRTQGITELLRLWVAHPYTYCNALTRIPIVTPKP